MTEIFKTAAIFAADLPAMPLSNAIRWHFADLADLRIPAFPPAGTWNTYETERCWNDTDSMRGASMKDALAMARDGWADGADQAAKLHDGIVASMPERKRLARFDIAGQVPNIPRALAGNPMNMLRHVRKETAQRPIVTLVCSIAVNWGYPPSAMLCHAAAMAAVVDFLESAGFRCEVLMVARTSNSRLAAEIAIKLKAAEQPLNLSVMAYGLGHPAIWRRMIFALLWMTPEASPLGSGLGSVDPVKAMPEAGTYTVQSAAKYDHGDRDMSAASRFKAILASLADQGCPGIPQDAEAA